MRSLFREIDENHDGTITPWELRRGLRDIFGIERLGEVELNDLVRHLDLNGNGKISFREFESFVESRELNGADVEDVLIRLREEIEQRYSALQDAFEEFDRNMSGAIERDEMHQGFRSFGIKLTVAETEKVMRTFESHGCVRYRDFVAAMRGVEPRCHSYRDPCGHKSATYAIRRLSEEVKRCARDSDGLLDFRRVFHQMDKDGSGTLDKHEISATLERYGINLTRGELIEVMITLGDGGRHSEISIEKFLLFALQQDPGTKSLLDSVRNEIDRISQRLNRPPDYRQAFRELDLDGTGNIKEHELREAMRNLQLRLSPVQVKQIIRMFDADGNNRISCREFVDFMEGISNHY